ncbi:MAG TPA: hypothetical protein VHD33_07550 [Legionellaceae bacterium]|nr:hypothetical protein [Legionellaceae bacterium]
MTSTGIPNDHKIIIGIQEIQQLLRTGVDPASPNGATNATGSMTPPAKRRRICTNDDNNNGIDSDPVSTNGGADDDVDSDNNNDTIIHNVSMSSDSTDSTDTAASNRSTDTLPASNSSVNPINACCHVCITAVNAMKSEYSALRNEFTALSNKMKAWIGRPRISTVSPSPASTNDDTISMDVDSSSNDADDNSDNNVNNDAPSTNTIVYTSFPRCTVVQLCKLWYYGNNPLCKLPKNHFPKGSDKQFLSKARGVIALIEEKIAIEKSIQPKECCNYVVSRSWNECESTIIAAYRSVLVDLYGADKINNGTFRDRKYTSIWNLKGEKK